MNRDTAESYDKEGLIRLVLSQAETIAVLTQEMAVLRARVIELEAKLGLPAKTPDNSSTPPSRGRKASGEVTKKPERKAHAGTQGGKRPRPHSRDPRRQGLGRREDL
jgi:transposase